MHIVFTLAATLISRSLIKTTIVDRITSISVSRSLMTIIRVVYK